MANVFAHVRNFTLAITCVSVAWGMHASARLYGNEAENFFSQARKLNNDGKIEEAIAAASKAIDADSDFAPAYYLRGRLKFRVNEMKASVADFNRYIELQPGQSTRQWERGIALYYAGEYAAGAKQFEDYQTYHSNDVENSVWRYLCIARATGVEDARKTLLPIRNDPRPGMMTILAMYAGKATEKDVQKAIAAAEKSRQPAAEFYANLYVGLYWEAHGKADLAEKYIKAAAASKSDLVGVNSYMWDVARIHALQFQK